MNGRLDAYSWGARVAGIVIALGYSSGLVAGSIDVLISGLALVTLGRAVIASRQVGALSAAALAVLAGALVVGASRWATLDLDGVRGAQAVLGPTLVVSPPVASAACWLAAAAAVASLGTWLVMTWPRGAPLITLWGVEALVGALAITSVFWGPAVVSGRGVAELMRQLSGWVAVIALALVVTGGVCILQRRLSLRGRWIVVAATGLCVVVAEAVIVGAL